MSDPPSTSSPSGTSSPPPAATVETSIPAYSVHRPVAELQARIATESSIPLMAGTDQLPSGRLTAIEITNYRAFRGTFRLELPKGENLLVYGENGAGKSSLYHALRVFLESPDWQIPDPVTKTRRPVLVTDHRHRFTAAPPTVKLEFGDKSFEWTETKNDTTQSFVRLVNQGKGFLDYRALLEVHHVRFDESTEIDLFPLLIRRLLPYYTYPYDGSSRTFQERWDKLNGGVRRWWSRVWTKERFLKELNEFNEALERTVNDLGGEASAMLETFGDEFRVEFRFLKAEFLTRPRKHIAGPRILALPTFRKQQFADYHSFFNEAQSYRPRNLPLFRCIKKEPRNWPANPHAR